MLKITAVFLFLLSVSCAAQAQAVPAGFDLSNFGVRIDPDKRVMAVLATLESARTTNAAGESEAVIKTPLSAEGMKFRELLQSDLAALPADFRAKVGQFLVRHKKLHPEMSDSQIVAPFVAMAYTLTPAPELADPVVTTDLPGNLLDVLDFAPLVREFWRRSTFSQNIDSYLKLYRETASGKLLSSTREMVNDILNYLHTRPQLFFTETKKVETLRSGSKKATISNTERRERERRFNVVPEMLAPIGDITYLNVRDDYYVVVPPDSDVSQSDVRRGFLQFVIDPIVLARSKEIVSIRPALTSVLDARRKEDPNVSLDPYLAISRSLVAAVDARQVEEQKVRALTAQARQKIGGLATDAEKRALADELANVKRALADETVLKLADDYEKGAVLDFYFADQVKGLEDSGFDISASIREMILSFDAAKESQRIAANTEVIKHARAARLNRKTTAESKSLIAGSEIVDSLREVQSAIDAGKLEDARSKLIVLKAKNPNEARVYYNMGRVASLSAERITEAEGDRQQELLIEAKTGYEKVVELASAQKVDPALVSLTYVALAKIYEFYDNRAYASALYDRAIQLGPITGGAYDQAMIGKAALARQK